MMYVKEQRISHNFMKEQIQGIAHVLLWVMVILDRFIYYKIILELHNGHFATVQIGENGRNGKQTRSLTMMS